MLQATGTRRGYLTDRERERDVMAETGSQPVSWSLGRGGEPIIWTVVRQASSAGDLSCSRAGKRRRI